MTEIAFSSVGNIIKVAAKIKKAVKTAKQNKEEVDAIQGRVERVEDVVKELRTTDVSKNPAMKKALAHLHKTLHRALDLVKDCEKKNRLSLLCTAGDLSSKLLRVQDDISQELHLMTLATTAHINKKFGNANPTSRPQGAEEITDPDHSTGDASLLQQPPTHQKDKKDKKKVHVDELLQQPTTHQEDKKDKKKLQKDKKKKYTWMSCCSSQQLTKKTRRTRKKVQKDKKKVHLDVLPQQPTTHQKVKKEKKKVHVDELLQQPATHEEDKKHQKKVHRDMLVQQPSTHQEDKIDKKKVHVDEWLQQPATHQEDKKDNKKADVDKLLQQPAIHQEDQKDRKKAQVDKLTLQPTTHQEVKKAGKKLVVDKGSGSFEKGEAKVETGVEDQSVSSSGLTMFSLSELNAATNYFSADRVIGGDDDFTVYKGVLRDGLVVSLMKFYSDTFSKTRLLDEVKIGAKLKHKNVVKLLGYCVDDITDLVKHNGKTDLMRRHILVLDYLPNGSLRHFMEGKINVELLSSGFQIIQEIAQGVHYLHEQRIIHGDLKPDNIFFDARMNPVIINFGKSVSLEPDVEEAGVKSRGSFGYMAPETFKIGSRLSMKSDVYAFGSCLARTIVFLSTGKRDWFINWTRLKEELMGLLEPIQVDESLRIEMNRYLTTWR